MADGNQNIPNPLAQTANPQRVLPDGTSKIISGRPVPLNDREVASGGGSNCPLWDGHIIDVTVPLV
jgi:hypothetical protein